MNPKIYKKPNKIMKPQIPISPRCKKTNKPKDTYESNEAKKKLYKSNYSYEAKEAKKIHIAKDTYKAISQKNPKKLIQLNITMKPEKNKKLINPKIPIK